MANTASLVRRDAPMTRVVHALIDLAGSDAESLLRSLVEVAEEDGAMFATITEADPLALAKLRGILAMHELVQAEEGCLAAGDVAEILRVSRQAVDKRRRSGALLAVSIGRRGWLYPVWQFTETGEVVPWLKPVRTSLEDADSWSQIRFFVSPNSVLEGRSPVSVLREGGLAEVERAARIWGTHGAA